MTLSTLAKGVLLLALGLTQQAAAACTKSVTAKQGDTCATLSSAAGITVTQFLRSNPAVTSCSTLVVGGSYCLEGTADSAPASSTAPSGGGLKVSSDGACGNGVTCLGSAFGDCCSAHGFCGGSADYCGDGCQAGFGACGGGAVTTAPGGGTTPPAGSVTVTVTNTVGVTRTSVVYQTSTRTEVTTQTRTAAIATSTVTQTVRTTATIPVTAIATTTSTAVITMTSISTSIRTSVTSRTVVVTSLEVDTITSIVTSTRVVTSAGCTQPTKTTGIIYTTTQVQGGRPTPTIPGTPSNCEFVLDGGDRHPF